MQKFMKPKQVSLLIIALLLGASGLFFLTSGSSSTHSSFAAPTGIVPGPAGIVSGALDADGQHAWVLTNTGSASNAQYVSITTGKVSEIIPTSLDATSIAIASKNLIAVGSGTSTTGFVALINTNTKTEIGTIPTAGPVSALRKVPNSNNLYAMISTPTAKALQILNPMLMQVEVKSLPLPLDATAFVPSRDGQSIIVLKGSGTITYLSSATGQLTQTFKVGANPIAVAINTAGTRLYVLKGTGSENVAVVNTTTEAVLKALPAPTHARDIAIAASGDYLVNFVGTNLVGNIQTFSTN
jgi:hypothetical protein